MNDEHLEAILIDSLAALEAGATVEQVLARYPAKAEQLGPMLRAAACLTAYGSQTLDATPTDPSQAREAFLARTAAMSPQASPVRRLAQLARSRVLLSFLTVAALVIMISSSVLGASAASLPGDPLYGVKRSFENIQLSLALNPAQRVNLEDTYTQRRAKEVKAVQASKRSVNIDFVGPVEAITLTEWTIGGFVVQVVPNTIIEGAPQIGDLVEVTGYTLSGGQIIADRIGSEGVELAGVVETMQGQTWIIGGKRVLVTQGTRIVGTARLGAKVEVHARRFPDGTLLALKVEFDDLDLMRPGRLTATPMPDPTLAPPRIAPTATATARPKSVDPTEKPTDTGRPDRTPEPTDRVAPRPSQTPEPSEMPEPSRTPAPLRTPAPSRTPQPSKTPEPTEMPEPSRTPAPSRTSAPSRTPQPLPTLEPTETHTPGQTPQPTQIHEPTETPKPAETHQPTETARPAETPEPTETPKSKRSEG